MRCVVCCLLIVACFVVCAPSAYNVFAVCCELVVVSCVLCVVRCLLCVDCWLLFVVC